VPHKTEQVAAHLDDTNPIAQSAFEARDLVAAAPDERRQEVFEHAFIRLRDKLGAWVKEGFQAYLAILKEPDIAARQLRDYLETNLGHQLKLRNESEALVMPVWFHSRRAAHHVIVWWVAEASSGEGDQCFAHIPESPDELPATDAEMLADIDPSLAKRWIPPFWLWRFPQLYPSDHKFPAAHTPETGKRELAYIHFQLWETLEAAIGAAKSRAEAIRIQVGRRSRTKPEGQRINKKYERIYNAARAAHAIHQGRAKLSSPALQQICRELESRTVPVPKQWDVGTWSDGLRKHPAKFKAYISKAVQRYIASITSTTHQ
jgi:HPt (histidine-containing phosphotransfer) domain-containing protein